MRIFAVGDINAKPGRIAVKEHLRKFLDDNNVDFCVANIDNLAHGLGATLETVNEVLSQGIDICTGGNHLYDKSEIIPFLQNSRTILKPLNYSKYMPGIGVIEINKNSKKYLVVHLAGQHHMPQYVDNPFIACDEILQNYRLGENVDAIIIDFHAETTSEKVALGQFLDGRVSFVFGTHTHIPTADAHILENGTAYITDLGMTGNYNSVIGVKKEIAIQKFLKQGDVERFVTAPGEATLCGALVEIEDTGLASAITQVKIGGYLERTNVRK